MKTRSLSVLFGLCLLAGALAGSSSAQANPVVTVVVVTEFEPLFYDGYVVFYDELGRPFIYLADGSVFFIPATCTFYNAYTSHFRTHRAHYLRWVRSHGRKMRTFRLAASHRRQIHGPRGKAHKKAAPARKSAPSRTRVAPPRARTRRAPAVQSRKRTSRSSQRTVQRTSRARSGRR